MGHVMVELKVVSEDFWQTPPPFNQEEGTSFGWYDRWYQGMRNGLVFDYSDWTARDLEDMLKKWFKARQLEGVLTGPLMSASHQIEPGKNDKGEHEWLTNYLELDEFSGGMDTPLGLVIAQMYSATIYKKAFFEKVWAPTPDGKIGYSKLAWRPQTTCRVLREPRNGGFRGFEQEGYALTPMIQGTNKWPITVDAKNAFVHFHGTHRDPMNGISELEIAYWCYRTQQKLLFLWFNYLEVLSHPRVIVKAQDEGIAIQIAGQIAQLKGGGVLPVGTPGGTNSVATETMDVSGKGSEEFKQAVEWLDQSASNSVMAGFLNLTDSAKSGGGWALSKDASNFYLQSLEYKSKEGARSIRRYVIAPLIRLNFGPDAAVPKFQFEPLNTEDKSDAVTMLTDLLRSRDPALVPDEFIGMLATMVADYMGMDGDKVRKSFDDAANARKAMALQQGGPAMASPTGQQVAGVAGAVQHAGNLLQQHAGRGGTFPGINGPQLPRSY